MISISTTQKHSVLSLLPWTTCVRCAESPGKAGRRLGAARRSQHGPNPQPKNRCCEAVPEGYMYAEKKEGGRRGRGRKSLNKVSTDIALITVHALSSVLSLLPRTTIARCAESPGKAGRRPGTAREIPTRPNPPPQKPLLRGCS